MPESRLSWLLKRHFSRQINTGEREELASLVAQSDDELLTEELRQCWAEYQGIKTLTGQKSAAILKAILQDEAGAAMAPVHRIHFLRRSWLRRVAAAVLVIALGSGAYFLYNRKTVPASVESLAARGAKNYIRNITLPDGSTIVLQAGGVITYPAAFNEGGREVTLEGEAYFDVAHDTSRPFIIHTGKVTTTVLGTAFDIKAFPGQKNIVVSVTRGKVKVEDEQKLLAVLTPDQQLDYRPEDATLSRQQVDANTLVTDWTKQDMLFEEASFEDVAEILKKRYDVTIEFENRDLIKCPIHASFKGTEKLSTVLNVVCKVQGVTYYLKDDKTIVISGKGCGN